jgi:hypothetical protein
VFSQNTSTVLHLSDLNNQFQLIISLNKQMLATGSIADLQDYLDEQEVAILQNYLYRCSNNVFIAVALSQSHSNNYNPIYFLWISPDLTMNSK